MEANSYRLGKCEVCADNDAKYTCPKCEVKTCCLRCVKIHKSELQCDGIRNKVVFKKINQFSSLDLLSDYRLFEDMARSIDSSARNPLKHYSRQFKELPKHLYRLRAAATKRGTKLKILPGNFVRHKQNTTYLNWKTQVISWSIEWMFLQCNVKHFEYRVDESSRLSALLHQYLDPTLCLETLKEPLRFYQSAGCNGVSLLLKTENGKFHLLNSSQTLKHALRGKTIVEFPTICVILKGHLDAYELVDSDEECEHDEEAARRYQENSLLFHNPGNSSEGSDVEEKSKAQDSTSVKDQELLNYSRPFLDVQVSHVITSGKLPSASVLLNGDQPLKTLPHNLRH